MTQRFLKRREVERDCCLSRSTIYEMMAQGKFPKPVPLRGRRVAWIEAEIVDWQERRIAERDRPLARK
jgi:prophage regulatory protein